MSVTEEERVAQLVHDIKVFVQPRRVRMKEFFRDFDHLRVGRCTRPQMERALSNLGMHNLLKEDVELLAEYFEEHHVEKPQNVNYAKFSDMIDDCFLEGNPDPLNSACSPGNTMMSTFRPNSFEDEEVVMHVLHRVATLCKTRGIVLKHCFQDITHTPAPNPSRTSNRRGGKVTIAQFMRMFPFVKDMGENDMNVLIERYKTKSGDVHFQALHNDVSAVQSHEPPPFPTSPLVLRPDETTWSHESLHPVQKLLSKCVEKRVRLQEMFTDFDPLRKGFCTVGQLKTVLNMGNMWREITKDDFDKLVYTYIREDGLFNFAAFCQDIDRGFTVSNLERDPHMTVTLPDASTTAPARRNNICLSMDRRSKIAEVEDKIRTRVRLRRVLMKPMFVDMDRAKRGFITRNQFARAMTSLGFELTELDIGLLAGVYCNFGNHMDFNYCDFLKNVDPPDEDCEVAMQQMSSPFQAYVPPSYFDDYGRVIPSLVAH
eukprot:TRINITY_DN7962_c0_g1_i1.p1 TRINITY_DN7962_c0_g1~~TRINITY_DN7962_c0_g1_i1.p1  ORF type:complete len:513 (-),score=113.31 TRINITY_DN7962_c0_g1_i1:248-1705(-)